MYYQVANMVSLETNVSYLFGHLKFHMETDEYELTHWYWVVPTSYSGLGVYTYHLLYEFAIRYPCMKLL